MKKNINPQEPKWEGRDRFVLSKGHAAPCYYAVLGERGYFDKNEFKNFRQLHSILQGHPDTKKCPGVDASTGSLGQGISIAVGMALGEKKLQNSTVPGLHASGRWRTSGRAGLGSIYGGGSLWIR